MVADGANRTWICEGKIEAGAGTLTATGLPGLVRPGPLSTEACSMQSTVIA